MIVHGPTPEGALIVGTGRCGSTLLSNVLAKHPDVLVLSELFSSIHPFAFDSSKVCTSRQLTELLMRPRAESAFLYKHHIEPPEYLYPVDAGLRYNRSTGVPPIAITTAPAWGEGVPLDSWLEEFVGSEWPAFPTRWGSAFAQLFEHLALVAGKRIWIERSGASLLFLDELLRLFPGAYVVHIYRDGRNVSLSMSKHSSFQLGFMQGHSMNSVEFDDLLYDLGRFESMLARSFGEPASETSFRKNFASQEWFARWWSFLVTAGVRRLNAVDHVLHVCYEDLLREPLRILKSVAEFLGLGASDAWLAYAAGSIRVPDSPLSSPLAVASSCRPGLLTLNRVRADGQYSLDGTGGPEPVRGGR